MDYLKIYDEYGTEKDWNWLVANFGDLPLQATGHDPGYKLVSLRDTGYSASNALVVKVVDEYDAPMSGVQVAFYWPDAPEGDAGEWYGRYVVGVTNAEGDVGFGMGSGAYYWPNDGQVGPHAVWVIGNESGVKLSDLADGLGMIAATNHKHLDVTFKYMESVTPPPSGVRFYDSSGTEQDASWAQTYFGIQDVHEPDQLPAYKLTALREENGSGNRVLSVHVSKADGTPASGINVALAPRDVSGDTLTALTGSDGVASINMTDAHKFYVPGQGHYVIGLVNQNADVYNSAGWVAGADRWLNAHYQLVEDEPPPPPPPTTDFKIIDRYGVEKDANWLHDNFGEVVNVEGEESPRFSLTQVAESYSEALPFIMQVTVVDIEGTPVAGKEVSMVDMYNLDEVKCTTNDNGVAGFEMLNRHAYNPDTDDGDYAVSVVGDSDTLTRLGWTTCSNAWLNPVFQFTEEITPPPPPPPPPPDECPDLTHLGELLVTLGNAYTAVMEEYIRLTEED